VFYIAETIVYWCQCWEDIIFSSMYNERTLDDLCYAYWERYTKVLAKSEDGYLLLEQWEMNVDRSIWMEGRRPVYCLYRSKRFVPYVDILGQKLYINTNLSRGKKRMYRHPTQLIWIYDISSSIFDGYSLSENIRYYH
jgi:hypothetical protein